MKRKVGLSLFYLQKLYGDRRALEIASEVGADTVDFSLIRHTVEEKDDLYSREDAEIEAYFKELGVYATALGLEFSQTHGRLCGYRRDPEENARILENARLDCLATRALGAPVSVFHAVATGLMGVDTPPEEMREVNFKWFTDVLPYAKQYGIRIATETFGDSPKDGVCDFFGIADEFDASFERIASIDDNRDYFCTCADTGHSNKATRFGNPTPADVIRRLGKSLAVLHLNDNDTLTDQHKIPMTGCIDWKSVFDALDEVGYCGSYNMEVRLNHFGDDFAIEEARFAVKVMRQMLKDRYGA